MKKLDQLLEILPLANLPVGRHVAIQNQKGTKIMIIHDDDDDDDDNDH